MIASADRGRACLTTNRLFGDLRHSAPGMPYSAAIAVIVIFGIRALAIYRLLEMPAWLTHEPRRDV